MTEAMQNPLHYRRERINPVCGAVKVQGQRLRLTDDPRQATCVDCQRWLEQRIKRTKFSGRRRDYG